MDRRDGRMHELAIAEAVVSAVLEHAPDQSVSVVHLRVGRLSGVVPDALMFCFDLAAVGTPLEGARLEIEDVEAHAHCRTCGVDFTMSDSFLLCMCGSADVELLTGRDLALASVEVS